MDAMCPSFRVAASVEYKPRKPCRWPTDGLLSCKLYASLEIQLITIKKVD
jgi:hypothetical protein